MKRIALLLATAALALAAPGAGTAGATTFIECDPVKGTAGDDRLAGDASGPCFDTISGRGGDDLLRGLRLQDALGGGYGSDTVSGGPGRDRVTGGRGEDRLYGGDGNDRIESADLDGSLVPFRDVVDCGAGHDRASADDADRVMENCEEVVITIVN